jgi:GNAT superfamily N-acetyltransferase
LLYTAEADNESGYGTQLIIRAYDGRKEIATAEFMVDEDHKSLVSANTWVLPKYQAQGVATTMYSYAKQLGNDVVPSRIQSDQGERMWRAWNQAKQSKHILPKGHKGFNNN